MIFPVSRTPRPGSVVWLPWVCGLKLNESAMNGSCPPRVWGPAGGVVVCDARLNGVPAPNWSSAIKTFGSRASPRGRNASLLRCFLADDRAPRLPNTIGDSLLPRPDSACATWDCGSTRSRRVIPGRPVRGVARTTPETSRLGAPPPGAPVYLSNFGPEVIQTPSKPPLRRPSRLSPTLFFGSTETTRTPDTSGETATRRPRPWAGGGASPSPGALGRRTRPAVLVPGQPSRGLVVLYTQSASPGSARCRVEGNPCSGSEENARTLSTGGSGGERSSPCWRWDRNRVAPANFSEIGRTRTPPRPSSRRAATRAGGSMHSRSNLLRCRDLQIPTTPSSRRRRPMTPRRKLSRPCPSGPTTG